MKYRIYGIRQGEMRREKGSPATPFRGDTRSWRIGPSRSARVTVRRPRNRTEVVMNIERRRFVALFGSLAASLATRPLQADQPALAEPVHRVANASTRPADGTEHPLDRALEVAREGLDSSRENIQDYTAVLVKREQVGGVLGQHEYMFLKMRNRKLRNGEVTQPFSVYLSFMKPASVKGREVIYVEGQNGGKMIAHEGGIKGKFLPTVSVPPDGMLAMRGQRYPLTEIGLENLIEKLIERGETARKYPDVTCEFRKGARLKDRPCTVIQVTQPTRRPDADFYLAQVFIDDEFNVPIRYIAYDWPTSSGDAGDVIEEYNYLNLEINVGLTDSDFNPQNKAYNFYS